MVHFLLAIFILCLPHDNWVTGWNFFQHFFSVTTIIRSRATVGVFSDRPSAIDFSSMFGDLEAKKTV
jgi:hypothetical protein